MHTIAPILCYLAGAIALMMGITYLVRFIRYRHFPSVAGQLLSSTVTEALVADKDGTGRTYLAVISYSYSVGGQRLNSSQVFSFVAITAIFLVEWHRGFVIVWRHSLRWQFFMTQLDQMLHSYGMDHCP